MGSGLLKDIKLRQASADQAQAPVSLEELLIEECFFFNVNLLYHKLIRGRNT